MRHDEPETAAHNRLPCRALHAVADRQRPIGRSRQSVSGFSRAKKVSQTDRRRDPSCVRMWRCPWNPGIPPPRCDQSAQLPEVSERHRSSPAGPAATLKGAQLEFIDNQVENTFFQGETAVEDSLFAIRVTPKAGGASSVFKGRSMVVYVRYALSPTGWASIREVVQAAS
jgi:hypothetical protein